MPPTRTRYLRIKLNNCNHQNPNCGSGNRQQPQISASTNNDNQYSTPTISSAVELPDANNHFDNSSNFVMQTAVNECSNDITLDMSAGNVELNDYIKMESVDEIDNSEDIILETEEDDQSSVSDEMAYSVCLFKDYFIATVPSLWMEGDTCKWPPSSLFYHARKNKMIPEKNWEIFKCRILFQSDDLPTALQIEKKASNFINSDDEKQDEKEKIGKRKHPAKFDVNQKFGKRMKVSAAASTSPGFTKKKIEQNSEASASSSKSSSVTKKNLEQNRSSNITEKEISQQIKEIIDGVGIDEKGLLDYLGKSSDGNESNDAGFPHIDDDDDGDSFENNGAFFDDNVGSAEENYDNTPIHAETTDQFAALFSRLGKVERMVAALHVKLDQIIKNQQGPSSSSENETILSTIKFDKVTTIEGIMELEIKLKSDPAAKKDFIKSVQSTGGPTSKKALQNFLYAMFSDEILAQQTYKGRLEKPGFIKYAEIISCLKTGIRANFSTSTEYEIDKFISDHIRYANSRCNLKQNVEKNAQK